jgi:hypothetical protein
MSDIALDQLPFDRVALGGRVYSPAEFMALPLSQRVRHLLKHEVTFLRGETHVRAAIALSALRLASGESRAQSGSRLRTSATGSTSAPVSRGPARGASTK